MISNTLAALGFAALLAWMCLLGSLEVSQIRPLLLRWFGAPVETGGARILKTHLVAGGLGALAALSYAVFLQESGNHLKIAVLPFGSAALHLLMFLVGGSTLATSLGMLGRVRGVGTYLLGFAVAGSSVLPTADLIIATFLCMLWLTPFLLFSIRLKGLQKTALGTVCLKNLSVKG
jgi:hypothetical protein